MEEPRLFLQISQTCKEKEIRRGDAGKTAASAVMVLRLEEGMGNSRGQTGM